MEATGTSHEPVLVEQVLQLLNLRPGHVVVDGTAGSGGHAFRIAERIGPTGRLVAVDCDPEACRRVRDRLQQVPCQVSVLHAHYQEVETIIAQVQSPGIDRVLLDLGLSSEQLGDPARGFSFMRSGPLDMRMNPASDLTAEHILLQYSESALADLFHEYGQERFARRIARAIVRQRKQVPLSTTTELAALIRSTVPGRGRRDPSTRVFQALRIVVNDELGGLESALSLWWNHVNDGGRMAVIAFHSLEDRIVKRQFRTWSDEGEGVLMTRRPVVPTRAESLANPRSRSAKFRVVERTSAAQIEQVQL